MRWWQRGSEGGAPLAVVEQGIGEGIGVQRVGHGGIDDLVIDIEHRYLQLVRAEIRVSRQSLA
jgi:hypothetical protein